MKWALWALTVVVAGSVAAFAVYALAWRETGNDDAAAREEAKAQMWAQRLASDADGRLIAVRRESPFLWRFRVEIEGEERCYLFHVDPQRSTRYEEAGTETPC